ncbi:MAG: hypothetical protein ABIH66_03360, partial [bacterium]
TSATLPGGARRAVDLGGEWQYRTGFMGKWHAARVPGDLGGVFGISWKRRRHFYRREVELPEGVAGKRVFVCFEGVGGEFRVTVDGRRAGPPAEPPAEPPAPAFLPAEFEITKLVGSKKNFELSVSVLDAHGPRSPLRPGRIGFAFAKGIYGGVRLEVRPPAFIGGAALNLESPDQPEPAQPELEITLDGTSEHPTALSLSCAGAKGGKRFEHSDIIPPFEGGKTIRLRLAREAVPEWSPDNPEPYKLVVKTASGPLRDELAIPFGRNAVKWQRDGAVIGGKKRKLIGISWLDFLPPYGASMPAWAVQRDVRTIKEAGFNFVWIDQLPPTGQLLDACDREGILVAGQSPTGKHPWLRQASLHPCLIFLSPKDEPTPFEIIRETVAPDPTNLKIPRPRPKTEKPAILHIEHFDGSLASDSRRVRDHRRAAFDLELLQKLEAMPVAGAVLGSLIYWGYRIGLLAETRRPTFTHQALSNHLKKGAAMPVNIERPLPSPPFLIPALAAALLAIAVPATKPFIAKILTYPGGALSFTHPWESLLLKTAATAAVALAVSNRLHARPLGTLKAVAPLPLFLSRPMLRNRVARLAVIFLAWLYVWLAGTCACSWITGKTFAAILPYTAQAGVAELLLLLILLPGTPSVGVALGTGAAVFLYLLGMVPPAGAAAYGAVLLVVSTLLLKRV